MDQSTRQMPFLPSAPVPTAISSYAFVIAQALDTYGIDSAQLLGELGLTGRLNEDPLNRLTQSELARLFSASVERTGDPYFGLTVARHMRFFTFHALGHALVASSTLMDYCLRLERYSRIASLAVRIHVDASEEEVALRFCYPAPVCAESEDAGMGFVVRSMGELATPKITPLRIELHRPMPPAGDAPFRALMRAPVSFSHRDGRIVFARIDMQKPLSGAAPDLASVNDAISRAYLARLDIGDFLLLATQKITELLPSGLCSRMTVADALGLTPTLLKSRLALQGTSFRQLEDRTRQTLALAYLRQPWRSLKEVTFLLGMDNPSNFARAFQRWTGMSPTAFRAGRAAGIPAERGGAPCEP